MTAGTRARFAFVVALAVAPAAAAQNPPGHARDAHVHGAPDAAGRAHSRLDTARFTHEDVARLLAGFAPYAGPGPNTGHDLPSGRENAATLDDGAHAGGHDIGLSASVDPDAPMNTDGSGTGRLPADAPMEALHGSSGGWALMVHGAAFVRLTAQDAFGSGGRGAAGFGVPNWVMGMAQRPLGGAGRLTLRGMLSLDPLTEGGDGYPLLFQTGEAFEGARLVDRQHPHDFVSELSATLARRVAPRMAAFAYAAYPGEPALGPVAFMHRVSARHNPDAPLGHHWQDATHIVWGVATLGAALGPMSVEGSLFTGREPDEDRFAPDRPRFDSYSARVGWSPSPRWALQVSRGFLREPEVLEPGVSQWRTTASALYASPLGAGDVAASLVWGANQLRPGPGGAGGHHAAQQALLAEVDLRLGRHAVYGRAELAQKSPEELALDPGLFGDEAFSVGALTFGAAREVYAAYGVAAMLGGQATAYVVPEALRSLYGAEPVSLQVYLRLTPARTARGGVAPSAGHAGHGG